MSFGLSARHALVISLLAPLCGTAQTAERITLSGNAVGVYNFAGEVTVERGTGSAVIVEVRRGGADASRLRLVERTVDGRPALCIVYPDERIIYNRDNSRRNSTHSMETGDPCADSNGSRSRRRIEVRSSGSGVEAWADLRILVPAGRTLHVDQMVGRVNVDGVEATLDLDVASAPITTSNTNGALNIDAGSGSVNITTHRGALGIDVGSGSVTLDDIHTDALNVDTGSGGVTGTRIVADQLNVDTGSGDVDLNATTVQRGNVDTGSGRVRVAVTSINNLAVETGSGSVTLTATNDLNARLDISTGSGGISSDFPVQVNRTSRNRLTGTLGDGRGQITISTGSGSVRLVRGR